MTANVSHTNKFVGALKDEYENKIEGLNSIIESLQEEIRLIKLSQNRFYDL